MARGCRKKSSIPDAAAVAGRHNEVLVSVGLDGQALFVAVARDTIFITTIGSLPVLVVVAALPH